MNRLDAKDLEELLRTAEENLSEALELASGLKTHSSEEVLQWVIDHALDAWADLRRARRVVANPTPEYGEEGIPEGADLRPEKEGGEEA
jgi:hypothetical protein